jgi:DNA-nicking Smr family endonuclease
MAKRELKPDDYLLFSRATQDVRPLVCDKVHLETPRPSAIPKQKLLEEAAVKQDMLSNSYDSAEIETGDELLFIRPGTRHGEVRKLRRGNFSIHAELDLHGMRVASAYVAVKEFLHDCGHYNIRCARIVHGKGHGSWQKQPILKVKLSRWLRQHDAVLAFCSARPTDGGTGAVYVLIKKRY